MSKTMILDKPVHFFDKTNALIKYEAGIQEIPDEHAKEPTILAHFIARGAKVYDPKIIAKNAAENAAKAKYDADVADALSLLSAAKESGDDKKISAAQKTYDKLIEPAK